MRLEFTIHNAARGVAYCLGVTLLVTGIDYAGAAPATIWPNGTQAAVSLSYDDALNSQLDQALPALTKYGFKATFYLTLNSEAYQTRQQEWQALAKAGHELGNHSIHHACRASLENREWVTKEQDLDQWTIAKITAAFASTTGHVHCRAKELSHRPTRPRRLKHAEITLYNAA